MESIKQIPLTDYEEFMRILKHGEINTLFQPIVSLTSGNILGYEALSRGPEGSRFHRPDHLFDYAHEIQEVWKLDFLCRQKAIENAKPFVGEKKLFINIDPLSMKDSSFQQGFTKEYLKSFQLDTDHIVMEITEKTAIEDYGVFNKLLNSYREQGYSIAVDDAGSGYSGLRTLAETRPEYIKVDMELVRNIDKDVLKQELLKSIRTFSYTAGIEMIAEGIETSGELRKLIELGIDYGQGYRLGRPKNEAMEIEEKAMKEIRLWNERLEKIQSKTEVVTAEDLLRRDDILTTKSTVREVYETFLQDEHLQGIAVVQDEKPVGLVMRNKFEIKKELSPDLEEFLVGGINTVMDFRPLIVNGGLSVEEIRDMAVARREEKIYDYILVVENGEYQGIISVVSLLQVMVYR